MVSVVKPNWNNFKAKFNENPQSNFEWFCYLLFCIEYNKKTGIFRYKNQSGIETNPIKIDKKVIGWQAKFYENTLSSYKAELIGTLEKSKRDYTDINTLVFYTNQEWGQGKKDNDPKQKKEIESKAKKLGIDIIWNTASFFESPFVSKENKDISTHFFCLGESDIDKMNNTIIPRVNELNEQYKSTFIPIGATFIERSEVNSCIESLNKGKSIIIHGKAGNGKSGCTQGIVTYCDDNNIPYLAIKLDDWVPTNNIDKWGEELGLNISVDKVINMLSINESGVIILDQLDALRWTQSHSRRALIICSDIISRINNLNRTREKNISIVFVCRTYDYENDNNIRSIFNNHQQENDQIEWKEVLVNELDEEIVRDIVGKEYENLSIKMKKILRIPSNLYIWEHLDKDKTYDDYSTANQLIQSWWNQLIENCIENGIDESELENTKNEIVDKIDRQGKLYVSCKILRKTTNKSLTYLSSSGFITLLNNNVSFLHQSIADYFLAQEMMRKYFDGEDILNIIGDKKKQTPQKRYQIQMLLQDIQLSDEDAFIDMGIKMLKSDEIRFYMKYVFLEVLGQSTDISYSLKTFILDYIEDDSFRKHIIDTVINGHTVFVDILIESGTLGKWMKLNDMVNTVIDLIISIRPTYTKKQIEFIRSNLLDYKEYAPQLCRCFNFDIHEDTDELFYLRMEFYEKYPELIESYIDFKELSRNCEVRAVQVIEKMLIYESNSKKANYSYERFIDEKNTLFTKNADAIIDILIKYIPKQRNISYYSKWVERDIHDYSVERLCVDIIKKANKVLIERNPHDFICRYNDYIGKGYTIFNEIILDGFEKIPIDFSDEIIQYILKNFNNIIFDESSGLNSKLSIARKIIKKHSTSCKDDIFKELENVIVYYIDPEAKDIYKRRVDYNINKYEGRYVYWSFWGDLQIELLPCLAEGRISTRSKKLLEVLKRRFSKGTTRYNNFNGHHGSVNSPITGKKLSNNQWLSILTNKKIEKRSKSKWIEVESGFIESSIEQFSRDFAKEVSSEPERFINLLLGEKKDINIEYIDALFSGVAYSDNLNNLKGNLLENMILYYRYDYLSFRARSVCRILEKNSKEGWSLEIIEVLKDIAINHLDPTNNKPNVTSNDDNSMNSFNMLQSNAINCTRGSAAEAIGSLLWSNKGLYDNLKGTVEVLCNDVNAAVRLATLQALYPIYNIDRDFAKAKIINMLKEDYRITGDCGMRNIFFRMYTEYSKEIDGAIFKCYNSQDEDLIRSAAYTISEMYIRERRYEEIILSVDEINQTQAKYIIEMAILYFNKEEYNDRVKQLIKRYIKSSFDLEFPLARIFYDSLIDLERDKEFLIDLMVSNNNKRIVHAFVQYLEDNGKYIMDYKEIILTLSWSIIKNYSETIESSWGIDNELSKLIIGLYDESTQNTVGDMKDISEQCLVIWDYMFENRIGSSRALTKHMLDR